MLQWTLGGIGLLVALLIIIPLAFTWYQALRLIRPPRRPLVEHPSTLGIPYEDVVIRGKAGKLVGWYLPGTNGRTLIALHGITDNRQQWLVAGSALQRLGFGILMFDFRAHGQSDGRNVTYGDKESDDVIAALDYLASRGDIVMDRVGVMGLSLGGITAVLAAAREQRLRAIMIESAFPDLVADLELAFERYTGANAQGSPIARLILFWGQLIAGTDLKRLRPVEVIDRLAPRSVFIIGDLDDQLVPEPVSSNLLYQRAGEPKILWQIPGAGHVGGYLTAKEEYITRLAEFFTAAL